MRFSSKSFWNQWKGHRVGITDGKYLYGCVTVSNKGPVITDTLQLTYFCTIKKKASCEEVPAVICLRYQTRNLFAQIMVSHLVRKVKNLSPITVNGENRKSMSNEEVKYMRREYELNDNHLLTRKQFENYNIKEVRLSKQRYAMLSSVVNSLNNYKAKKQAMVTFSGDSFYLVINLRDEDFAVIDFRGQNEDAQELYDLEDFINGFGNIQKEISFDEEIVLLTKQAGGSGAFDYGRGKNDIIAVKNGQDERSLDNISSVAGEQSGQYTTPFDGSQDITRAYEELDICYLWNMANFDAPEGVIIPYEDFVRSIENNGAFSIAENEESSNEESALKQDREDEAPIDTDVIQSLTETNKQLTKELGKAKVTNEKIIERAEKLAEKQCSRLPVRKSVRKTSMQCTMYHC